MLRPQAETWAHLEKLPEERSQRYWKDAYVWLERQSDEEINFLVDQLIAAERPHAAFHAVHMDFDKVEMQRLMKLLRAAATSEAEPTGHFQLAQHEISDALKSLANGVLPAVSWFRWNFSMPRRWNIPNMECPALRPPFQKSPLC